MREGARALSAPWLFGAAATFNLTVGLALLLLRPWLSPLLRLDPISGTNLILFYLAVGLIIMFGYSYALVARDPVRYRPYVSLGAIGKLIGAASVLIPWLAGAVSWRLAPLASGDLTFAVMFLVYLRQERPR